jgi:F-type H+-transporting ATPase subunit b
VRQDVLNRARVEHEELLNRAKADIETERARAIESVRRDAVDLALAAAAKLVEQKLDTENDRKLVTDFLTRAQKPGARA